MSVASLWFPLALTALALAVAGAVASTSPWLARLLAQQDAERHAPIDGLRGFLALGVFFTHVMTTRGAYAHGAWDASFAPFFATCGQAAVSLFFMITGYLFWRRALRPGALDARALFASRLRRLAPMYLVSVALVLLVAAAMSGFTLQEHPLVLAREVRAWLSFGFLHNGPLNGVADAHAMNAVYWTLAFEWGFYLALPAAALFAGPRAFPLLAAAVLLFGLRTPITLNFLAGALAAIAHERRLLEGRLASPWLAPLPLLALAMVLGMDTAYAPRPILLLFVFFLFVVDGNSLLGLLRARAARALGAVSYSFYLLHCIVLYVAFHAVAAAVPVAALAPERHWAVAALALGATIVASAFTYRYVEHPFAARTVPEPLLGARVAPGGMLLPRT